MRFHQLQEWLDWQETLHPVVMDLGLARPSEVLDRLGWEPRTFPVITVAGTNGKGSTVAFLDALLRALGYKTGSYTSPHLVRYNERICVDGEPVDDHTIMSAFEELDNARGETTLTYFEFGTLASVSTFRRERVDVAILEVGIGGAKDAVNLFDADVAVLTSIGIDHTRWLGDNREAIGAQKAGILRSGRPVVMSDPAPPNSVLARAGELQAPIYRLGREFWARDEGVNWRFVGPGLELVDLPKPPMPGRFQLDNAAGAIMALLCLSGPQEIVPANVAEGLAGTKLRGRFEVFGTDPEVVLDVAHNPLAARALAATLRERPVPGRTLAVVGMLADKDHDQVFKVLSPLVQGWSVGSLAGERGTDAFALSERIRGVSDAPVTLSDSIWSAYQQALGVAARGDRVLVFGSFHTVGEILANMARNPGEQDPAGPSGRPGVNWGKSGGSC